MARIFFLAWLYYHGIRQLFRRKKSYRSQTLVSAIARLIAVADAVHDRYKLKRHYCLQPGRGIDGLDATRGNSGACEHHSMHKEEFILKFLKPASASLSKAGQAPIGP